MGLNCYSAIGLPASIHIGRILRMVLFVLACCRLGGWRVGQTDERPQVRLVTRDDLQG